MTTNKKLVTMLRINGKLKISVGIDAATVDNVHASQYINYKR